MPGKTQIYPGTKLNSVNVKFRVKKYDFMRCKYRQCIDINMKIRTALKSNQNNTGTN